VRWATGAVDPTRCYQQGMVRWAWKLLRPLLSASVLVAVVDCGGESRQVSRRSTGGTGGARSDAGLGGQGMVGGTSSGGMPSTAGSSGGSVAGGMPGVGGRNVAGASGSEMAGAAGVAGEGTDPFGECAVPPLSDGTTCSLAATCDALDCGKPWSLYDVNGCRRETCSDSRDCPAGKRCVAGPVVGGTSTCWSSSCESCEELSGECRCTCTDDCAVRTVCLPLEEAPPEDDCSLNGLGCAALRARLDGLNRHLDDAPTGDVEDAVVACYGKLLDAEPDICASCEEWLPDDYFAGVTAESVLQDWESLCMAGRTIAVVDACELSALVLMEASSNVTWLVDDTGAVVGFRETTKTSACGMKTIRAGIQLDCGLESPAFCNSLRPRQLRNHDRTVFCDAVSTQCQLCDGQTCNVGPIGAAGAAGAPG
jgi:hypothetical protein